MEWNGVEPVGRAMQALEKMGWNCCAEACEEMRANCAIFAQVKSDRIRTTRID